MSRLSSITHEQRERLRQSAVKAEASFLPFITYDTNTTRFMLGTTDVTGTDFLAVSDRIEAVWCSFMAGVFEEISRVDVMTAGIPPKPNVYRDKDQWDLKKDRNGKDQPKDPLFLQLELPLIENDDLRIIILKASGKLIRAEVGRLIADLSETNRRPFITLAVEHDAAVTRPVLVIGRHSEDLEDIPLPGFDRASPDLSGASSSSLNGKSPPTSEEKRLPTTDINDSIPF